ncbi:MAG: TIGR03560 family F420-dependent LLM class oxidoreductase [Pseudomonadales bacterium]|nr:TIGR03560 family F420-dependent LLM class oxidoreductase [Pseudomonadales bacterium]MCP5185246.1 TIGR03560 family F420-dependent LLM class oxidoreductase [Pseudomonadales bacterium]
MKFGIHAGPQDIPMQDLIRLWKTADENGFHWVSVWDHFYANPLRSRADPCFEAVSTMAGLAAHTRKVRVGCLVFCALFRSPGMLAKAAVTIDHLSGGRAEIGIGAGWYEEEFRDFGYGFPPLGQRLDQLEEALTIIRSLWRDEETNFKGRYYDLQGAVCAPKPVNPGMRIWIGGRGKSRTPRLAATYGDGYNLPYVSPETAAHRFAAMRRECEKRGRDPAEVETSVNLGFYLGDRQPDVPADGCITGSVQQAIDRIGAYQDLGVQGLNIAFRPPVDWDGLSLFVDEVMSAFR